MVLAKKYPPPGKPVPYSCLRHPDDHALSTFGAGGFGAGGFFSFFLSFSLSLSVWLDSG